MKKNQNRKKDAEISKKGEREKKSKRKEQLSSVRQNTPSQNGTRIGKIISNTPSHLSEL